MSAQEWTQISDEDLLKQAKLYKKMKIYDAVIIGFLIGVSIYSIINNGFGVLTFLPLIYIPIAGRNNKKREELKIEVEKRGLDW